MRPNKVYHTSTYPGRPEGLRAADGPQHGELASVAVDDYPGTTDTVDEGLERSPSSPPSTDLADGGEP